METPGSKDKLIPEMPLTLSEYNISLTRKILIGFFLQDFGFSSTGFGRPEMD